MNCIHDNAKLIRLPWNKIISISKIHKLAEDIEKEQGRSVDIGELEEIYKDKEDVMRLFADYKYKYTILALDKPQTTNEKNLNDVIPSTDTNQIDLKQLQDEIAILLSDFTPREREIVKMYHGIGYVRAYTLKEIGIDLGLTRERIRQIKEKVFETIRKKKKLGKLKGLFND